MRKNAGDLQRQNLIVSEILFPWDVEMLSDILTDGCILQYEFKLEVKS